MKVYSLQVPQYSLPVFYKQNGMLRHVQDPLTQVYKPTHSWNKETKSLEKKQNSQSYDNDDDKVSVPWACSCSPEDVTEVVNQYLPPLEETVKSCYPKEELDVKNLFVVHTDLNIDPVWIGFCGVQAEGEKLWEAKTAEVSQEEYDYLKSQELKCQLVNRLLGKSRLIISFGKNHHETYVILDDQVIGFIQEIYVHVVADKQLQRKVEISFPKIDNPTWFSAKEFAVYTKMLESLGFVKVKHKEIQWDNHPVVCEEKVFASSSDEDFEKSLSMIGGKSEPG